jgi:hypothetical protein
MPSSTHGSGDENIRRLDRVTGRVLSTKRCCKVWIVSPMTYFSDDLHLH